MFVGSIYHRHEKETTELGFVDDSMLGYDTIEIMERVLSGTESRNVKVPHGPRRVVTYCYTVRCIVDGNDVAEIDEDLLNEEIMYGFYKFHGRSRP